MPLFHQVEPFDEDRIRQIVLEYWSLDLGMTLKVSQNHTFSASKNGEKYVVRVTLDPTGEQELRMQIETRFVHYLSEFGLSVSAPILPVIAESCLNKSSSGFVVRSGDLCLVVSKFAKGNAVNVSKWEEWLSDDDLIRVWGRWTGHFHSLSRKFSQEHPDLAKQVRMWDELHEGIMKGVPLDRVDVQRMSNLQDFGIIHGDVNISNFFVDRLENGKVVDLEVFDWDQSCTSWFLYDVALPIFSARMIIRAGAPVSGDPVHADEKLFEQWFLEGYEESAGCRVDRAALSRMIDLRLVFYERFCSRAIKELPKTHQMYSFIEYCVRWRDRERGNEEWRR